MSSEATAVPQEVFFDQAVSAAAATSFAQEMASVSPLPFPITTGSGIAHVSVLERVVEIVVALCALILTTPIMLLMALVIRLGTRGPILFFQQRIGAGVIPFRFVKF